MAIPHDKHYDYLLVGAGLFNAVFAYMANAAGKRCLVIDKRSHLGGNLYCEQINGITVHKYGPHIFHTSNKRVWDFVNSIDSFQSFVNAPVANYKGNLYNLPFNLNTFHQLWGVSTPEDALAIINEQTAEEKQLLLNLGKKDPENLEEYVLSTVGRDIYSTLIKGYTQKQWGKKCSELPPEIIKRIPLRFTFNNNYFNDIYQGIPQNGYNRLIEKLFDGTDYVLNCDYFDNRDALNNLADITVYSGPIDQFFDYKFGRLEYRTLSFETEYKKDVISWQGNAVVNYTDLETPFTRIAEYKYLEPQKAELQTRKGTVISKEYSLSCGEEDEPYYPIPDKKNNLINKKYQELTRECDNIYFGGRLAEYKYYDMDDVVARALDLSKSIIKKQSL